jgi:hypothetical protein
MDNIFQSFPKVVHSLARYGRAFTTISFGLARLGVASGASHARLVLDLACHSDAKFDGIK